MMINKGTLVRWLDDKGYGFIKQDNGEQDVFIHISALKGMSRKPIIGDVIHYQLGFDDSGKSRAVNAKIEGVSQSLTLAAFEERKRSNPSPARLKPYRSPANFSKPQLRFNPFPIIIVIVLVAVGYKAFSKRKDITLSTAIPSVEYHPTRKIEPQFQCQGKVHCSQMTSYEEAVFYLRNCSGTKIDGDDDGIPCESQF
ncbi:cold shock domain-containing protein [Methylicorpusculum oleiharenae]|uniref:cold shock domain-containing protein n=1 Tax=Methylicorpusculum oleiharenae TaxID=1338687 RepID=UPI00135C3392|nr:cold shock domain-containing protein [Methylicorpusculum oleiharenae]MCD2453359.1 cold shock domain-containing protein [Methylicorpusculum oleiharenae]